MIFWFSRGILTLFGLEDWLLQWEVWPFVGGSCWILVAEVHCDTQTAGKWADVFYKGTSVCLS